LHFKKKTEALRGKKKRAGRGKRNQITAPHNLRKLESHWSNHEVLQRTDRPLQNKAIRGAEELSLLGEKAAEKKGGPFFEKQGRQQR